MPWPPYICPQQVSMTILPCLLVITSYPSSSLGTTLMNFNVLTDYNATTTRLVSELGCVHDFDAIRVGAKASG